MDNGASAFIKRLKLTNYRNYQSLDLATDNRHVVLTGDNGAGKTNLLEAISFLSPGRGMRRSAYDLVASKSGDGTWSIFTEMVGSQGDVTIGTGIAQTAAGPETTRRVRIDGDQVKSSDELLDHLRVVWLIPAMDGLFTGAASDRRRFLDRMVLAIDPAHGKRVSGFERTMRNRNKLLGDDAPDPQWLDAIEIQLAELAVAIAHARAELVTLLSGVIVKSSDTGSPFPDALIHLEGTLEQLTHEMAAADLEDEYRNQLRNNRRMDAGAGRTLIGPHRSDMAITHRPKSMSAALCSTGEQKALLIGLVLAHARLVGDMQGAAPILLLDEIAAHLDERRRAALYDMIDDLGCQAWMTGTDTALFDSLGDRAKFFSVDNGSVSER